MKNTMEQIKISVESFNNRMTKIEERISELKDISFNNGKGKNAGQGTELSKVFKN